MRFAAEKLSRGQEWLWVPCSCVKTVRLKVPGLPRGNADDFVPNANMQNGTVLILQYGKRRHIAYKEKITNAGVWVFEGNYPEVCTIGRRLIPWSQLSRDLVGFYNPDIN